MPFINKDNQALLLDLYELAMSASFYQAKKDAWATFDLFIRHIPANRSFFVSAGLDDAIDYITNLNFSEQSIQYLRNRQIFPEGFLSYLGNFKFSGDVWALPEGTVFFPNEPILRVTAPIIEAQVIESFLLNTINIQTTIASKAARVVIAAKAKEVFDFSLRRTQGADASLKAARSSFIAGVSGTSNVLAGFLYNIPIAGTMAHSYVMSFDSELESFSAFSKTFKDSAVLLIDTYNTLKGAANAIKVAKELRVKGNKLKAVRLDSGDLADLSKKVRSMLDNEGFYDVKIFASGNLDEFKIEELLKKYAPIDYFGVGTNMGVSADAPYCDVIYKIVEVTDKEGEFLPTMKLSKGKITYPGRKQIFRIYDKMGFYVKDILGLEEEKITDKPLLIKVLEKGSICYERPTLAQIRETARKNIAGLPERYKALKGTRVYPVVISSGLNKLRENFIKALEKKEHQ